LTPDEIAKTAEFFSFGHSGLTQTYLGVSRGGSGGFLPRLGLSPPATEPYSAAMKKSHKVALIGLSSIVVLYLVVLLLAGLSPSVNDSDLRLTRQTLTPEENGFPALPAAASKMWWPEAKRSDLAQLATETNWNAVLATQFGC
jgi:hypothetical protein